MADLLPPIRCDRRGRLWQDTRLGSRSVGRSDRTRKNEDKKPPVLSDRGRELLAIHTREQCHYCSRFFIPGDLGRWVNGTIRICGQCYERHSKAVEVLGGAAPPDGCQECGAPWPHRGGGNYSMHIAQKDGVYQVLCRPCAERYVSQRRDLYPHAKP